MTERKERIIDSYPSDSDDDLAFNKAFNRLAVQKTSYNTGKDLLAPLNDTANEAFFVKFPLPHALVKCIISGYLPEFVFLTRPDGKTTVTLPSLPLRCFVEYAPAPAPAHNTSTTSLTNTEKDKKVQHMYKRNQDNRIRLISPQILKKGKKDRNSGKGLWIERNQSDE